VQFGPEVENFASVRAKTNFYPYGISGTDSHNAKPPMWTLQTLMQKHGACPSAIVLPCPISHTVVCSGHDFIDILKVDIEGSEFDTLTSMMKYYKEQNKPLPFGQLQLEIHADKITFVQFLKWWEDLEEAGLRPFWTEVGEASGILGHKLIYIAAQFTLYKLVQERTM
jgi:hypothetical protein